MDPKALRVLLVEDNPDDAELFQQMLKRKTSPLYIIVHRDRLRQALETMDTEAFDVVLLDLTLPDSEGIGTVRRVRAATPLQVPVVVLTGRDDDEVALQALQEGVQDYLVKDQVVDPQLLERTIRHATERQRALAEREHNQRLLLALSEGAQAVQRARTEAEVYHHVGEAMLRLGYDAAIATRCADHACPEDACLEDACADGVCLEVAYHNLDATMLKAVEELIDTPLTGLFLMLSQDGQTEGVWRGGPARLFPFFSELLAEVLPERLRDKTTALAEVLDNQQCIVARLALGDDPHGMLVVCGSSLTTEDIPAVTAFANQAAVALENIRHMELARASEARFRAIYEEAALGVGVWDLAGRLVDANPTLLAMTPGAPDNNGSEQTLASLFPPEENEERPIGERFMRLALGEDDAFRTEVRYRAPTGSVRWGSAVFSLVRNARHQPLFVIGMLDDISTGKEAQEALLRAEQLAVTGRLAAALAHEINNPLQAVIGCLGLADETLAEGGDVRRYMEVARRELHRTARIVGRLRDLQIPSSDESRVPVDVNTLMENILALLDGRLKGTDIEMAWQPSGAQVSVMAAPDRLHQVFLNLMLNAIDAMPEGGRLWLKTRATPDPAGVEVEIGDTGVGIAPEVLPHIFDFLYSTKAQGTGLGLFICQSIVKEHGGHICIRSTVGEGTVFTVWLPA
ncbi:MAG: hybrid sensor histidine kinase/response regulator [Anaerolineae bacterium]